MSNCTLCLANLDNSIKHFVANSVLQEIFERITNAKLPTNCRSTIICYICHYLLQRCHTFYKMSQRAEKTFAYLRSNKKEVSPRQLTELNLGLQSLIIIRNNHLSMNCCKLEVKEEIADDKTPVLDDMRGTVCRTCLVVQTNMHCIESKGLKNTFERVTNLQLDTEGRPTKICYICLSRLKKSHWIVRFRKVDNIKLSPEMAYNLSVVTTASTSLSGDLWNTPLPVPIKTEIKQEPEQIDKNKTLQAVKQYYDCEICDKKYKFMAHLKNHLKLHTAHFTPNYACGQCDAILTTKSSLTRHKKQHSSTSMYICDYCKKEFIRKETIERHIRLHTGLKPYACEMCDKRFAYIGNYRQHVKTHTNVKPYSCKRCSEKFYYRSALHRHMSVHIGQDFTCDYCNKTYHQKFLLKRHIQIHTNYKPYACTSCDKAYFDHGNLIIHMRRHTGERPFKCIKCNKMFSDESAMLRHSKTHEEKPFTCNICNMKVSTRFVLKSHMRRHTGIKPYRCMKCYKSYFSNNNLQRHLKTHSIIKPFACTKCDKSFEREASFNTHMFVHTGKDPNQCDILCNKKFAKPRYLRSHMKVHTGERRHACDQCGKRFADHSGFNRHKKIHSSETPHVCKICGVGFARLRGLRGHEKTHGSKKKTINLCQAAPRPDDDRKEEASPAAEPTAPPAPAEIKSEAAKAEPAAEQITNMPPPGEKKD